MNELQKKSIELRALSKDLVELRRDVQRRIRDGETTGRPAEDYLLAGGHEPDDPKLLREVEAFRELLRAYAGQTAAIVFAKRIRDVGAHDPEEVRLALLPAAPAFRFDDTSGGWTFGESFASITASDRSGSVHMARLAYSSTSGAAFPKPDQLFVAAVYVGNAEVGRFFRENGTFNSLDHQALAELIGATVPTAKLPRTETQRGFI